MLDHALPAAQPDQGARRLAATSLLVAALLSTNVTLGLTSTETVPALFLLTAAAVVLVSGRVHHVDALWLVVPMFCYACVGIIAGNLVDAVKLSAAALVAFAAVQFVRSRHLFAACRASILVLFVLRVASLQFPDVFVALYEGLGLRGTAYYGGTAAVLFAEPSYLATAVLALWGLGRLEYRQRATSMFTWVDLAAIALLALSFSVWAYINIVAGVVLILRRRPEIVLAVAATLGIVVYVLWSTDAPASRIGVFIDAMAMVIQSGRLIDFAMIDPSASHRLVQTYLAIASAIQSPFGQLSFELTPVLVGNPLHWSLPIFGSSVVALQILGDLYANTVPFQLLVYGGLPLFVLFMIPVTVACRRLWSMRDSETGAMLVLASIVFGTFGQSILSSPFLYLCIAVGLYWTPVSTDRAVALALANEDFSRHDQLQQSGRAPAYSVQPQRPN